MESTRLRAKAAKAAAFAPAPSRKHAPEAVFIDCFTRLVRRGTPCSHPNDEFRDRLQYEGWSAARVLASEIVSEVVGHTRLKTCRGCVHATVFQGGLMHCECCRCPRWRPPQVAKASDLRELTRHAQFMCPRAPPAFGPVDDDFTAD